MQKTRLLAGVLVAVMLVACAGRKSTTSAPGATQVATPPPAAATSAPLSGAGAAGSSASATSAVTVGMPAKLVVYFDFDSINIRPEFTELVAQHARYLSRNTSIRVRLEGNTDERGSREYNVGLGERRAQAVRRALLLQGVAESQVATVSYGEEKPAAGGSNEEAWAKNRRVEFAYQN